MKSITLLSFLFVVIISCKNATEKKEEATGPQTLESPSGTNASLPYLVTGADGLTYLSWVEKRDSGWVDLKYSVFQGDTWSTPELIATGNDWFVNWADYPIISADENGNMLASYPRKSSSGTYSYDVTVMRKPVDGKWSGEFVMHDDGTPTEHGFVTMLPREDKFLVAWLDGRNTGVEGGAMTLRSSFLGLNSEKSFEVEADGRVCDCCQTGGAMTSSGPVVVYRNRSELEIRDISIVRWVDDQWTDPMIVYEDQWKIEGCPVNGPRVAALGDQLAVAWFSAPQGQGQVKVIFSDDAGETFGLPVMIDGTAPLGRVDVDMIAPGKAIVSWMDMDMEKTLIKIVEVYANGTTGKQWTIAETSESRGSGFPQMTLSNGKLLFAWTELDETRSTVRVSSMTL